MKNPFGILSTIGNVGYAYNKAQKAISPVFRKHWNDLEILTGDSFEYTEVTKKCVPRPGLRSGC